MLDLKYTGYPKKWNLRFSFYDKHGLDLHDKNTKAEFLKLPFRQRMSLSINILGFLFGPIYFLCLGMWRKALTGVLYVALLSIVLIVLRVVLLSCFNADLPTWLLSTINICIAACWAQLANQCYYLKEVHGENGWNLFKGVSLRFW